jgi:serine/threonine-protein kinase
MGVVLLARDVQLDRYVAIKVLAAHLSADPAARERFLREARTAAGLSHPHIVPIHRVGEAAGFVFFVMSYVPGETLGERLRKQGPLPPAEVTRVVREVAWALAYAHGRGVVHRDVKPDNILLEVDTGRALVTDFGIARTGSTTLSADPGAIIGTAHFMSPEQAMNAPLDGRSDLYSLGVVAYVAVTGRLPFDADIVPALLMQHISATPRPVSEIAPGTPATLATAIHRCLEKEPAQRFATGEELAAFLMPAIERRPALPSPLRTWLSERNPAAVFYAGLSGLIGIPILYDLTQLINYRRSVYLFDLVQMSVLAAAPMIPVIRFHYVRARRLFAAGFTLRDLRGALDVAARERAETEALDPEPALTPPRRALRFAAYGTLSASAALTFLGDAVRFALERHHIVFHFTTYMIASTTGWVASLALFAAMSMKEIPLLPSAVRRFLRGEWRERIWRGSIGEFLAKRLAAPSASRPIGAGAFQATELAVGGAANELFNALPEAYREQLRELPSLVHALEERAQRARAELDAIERLEESRSGDETLTERRTTLKSRLAKSVAALESIRVDLLRLQVGASDIASLTTLLEEARLLGEDLARLTAAQREVKELLPQPRRDGLHASTPA